MDQQDLYRETRAAMRVIYEQWGDVRTPFGRVWRVGQEGRREEVWGWSSPITFGYEPVVIKAHLWLDKYMSDASLPAILKLANETLPAMANYLASEDFTNKVKGCIRRLKAITAALQA